VEVDNDRLVGGEQALESLLGQSMRVVTALTEDEQVVDIDNSNAQTGVSEKGGSSHNFESDLDTTADEHDVGIDTVLRRESLPDGGTSDAV
jgi:hypothetical protein